MAIVQKNIKKQKMKTEIKIEKNVPIPKSRNQKGEYPWDKMTIGDSIFISDKRKGESAISAFRSYIIYNRLDWKAAARSENDGVRIWRTK